ncbi:MAG: GntR family transcriptional regulator [Chitinivibrionales bacterium]|nr:GntR family transcriptional regulator [Chitinivibrionales bacterium]MBD3396003.1 GntR family transcriptional regulator [Chitinivibrionales bacterium]
MPCKARGLHVDIAQRLAADVVESRSQFLPSMRELAHRYEVSLPTMWKAVQLLKEEGLIEVA